MVGEGGDWNASSTTVTTPCLVGTAVGIFLCSKMDKTDNNTLTNQPEIVTIPSPILSLAVGCWHAGEWAQMLNFLSNHTSTDMRIIIFWQ